MMSMLWHISIRRGEEQSNLLQNDVAVTNLKTRDPEIVSGYWQTHCNRDTGNSGTV